MWRTEPEPIRGERREAENDPEPRTSLGCRDGSAAEVCHVWCRPHCTYDSITFVTIYKPNDNKSREIRFPNLKNHLQYNRIEARQSSRNQFTNPQCARCQTPSLSTTPDSAHRPPTALATRQGPARRNVSHVCHFSNLSLSEVSAPPQSSVAAQGLRNLTVVPVVARARGGSRGSHRSRAS